MNTSIEIDPVQGLSLDMAHMPAAALREYLKAIEPFGEDMLSRQMRRENPEHRFSSCGVALPVGTERGLHETLKESAWGMDTFIRTLET